MYIWFNAISSCFDQQNSYLDTFEIFGWNPSWKSGEESFYKSIAILLAALTADRSDWFNTVPSVCPELILSIVRFPHGLWDNQPRFYSHKLFGRWAQASGCKSFVSSDFKVGLNQGYENHHGPLTMPQTLVPGRGPLSLARIPHDESHESRTEQTTLLFFHDM